MFALVLDHLPAFNPISLSTVMWASISLGQRVPLRLMHAMYGATAAHLHTYPPRSLAGLVWAVSVGECTQASEQGPRQQRAGAEGAVSTGATVAAQCVQVAPPPLPAGSMCVCVHQTLLR